MLALSACLCSNALPLLQYCEVEMPCTYAQRSDSDHFLLEVPTAALGSDALSLAVRISNLRHRLLSLCEDGAELLRSGPAQRPQEEGADSDEEHEGNPAGAAKGEAVLSEEAVVRSKPGTAGAAEVQSDSGVSRFLPRPPVCMRTAFWFSSAAQLQYVQGGVLTQVQGPRQRPGRC